MIMIHMKMVQKNMDENGTNEHGTDKILQTNYSIYFKFIYIS